LVCILKKFDKALEIYDAGLTKFPNNAMLLSFRGNTHLELKDFKNAVIFLPNYYSRPKCIADAFQGATICQEQC